MAEPAEAKAIELLAQADKKSKSSSGGFLGLFSGGSKLDEAAELYVKAANNFKMAKKWAAAGSAFYRSAEMRIALKSQHEAATSFIDAANCFRKADPNEAVKCLGMAIEIYTDMGRFTIAAKHHITVAEIYESDIIDIEKVILNYERAADFYKGEESGSSANKCLLKVAQYAAQQKQYPKAIEVYEQVAQSSMDNQLLRYGAKDHFFRAAICRMCQDVQDAEMALQRYKEMFPAFGDSREYKLIKALCEALQDHNVEAFTEVIREYDSISKLDQWYVTMFLIVKKSIEEEDLK